MSHVSFYVLSECIGKREMLLLKIKMLLLAIRNVSSIYAC